MKLVELDNKTYENFAKNHQLSSYLQSTFYGNVMFNQNFDVTYIGLVDYTNKIIGASLVLSKRTFLFYKEAYLPHGFLLDYNNYDLVTDFTLLIKKLLRKNHYISMTMDPLIIVNKLDKKGKIQEHNVNSSIVMKILNKNKYIHKGFNKNFETRKPRYNAYIDLTKSENKLLKDFNKNIRNKINNAKKKGVIIYKGSISDLDIAYNFIKNKHTKTLDYYKSLLNYSNVEIYIAKIESERYVKNAKKAYDRALSVNEKLISKLFDDRTREKDKRKIMNKKMQSDIILSYANTNLNNATTFFQEKYEGQIVGAAIVIYHNNTCNLLIEGFNNKYREYNSNYLLKWEIIKRAKKKKYKYFNLNGISGNFGINNKYKGLNEMKLGYSDFIIEYIGEFDLIINKIIYYLHKHFGKNKTKKRK